MSDDESEFHYGGKFGWIYQDSKHFNDKEFLGDNYLQYKITKIKIWSGKKDNKEIINGIQVTYKNILNGKEISPGEYKGDEGLEKVDEFVVPQSEYLTKYHVRIDTEVTQIGFETNKAHKILIGSTTAGEDKIISSNSEDNIIVTLYGCYNNCLQSCGIGYVKKKDYMKALFIGFFELRFKLKKDENYKKEWIEKEKTLDHDNKALLKTCLLPDTAFNEIIKFCLI
jgi:hypothetical protein